MAEGTNSWNALALPLNGNYEQKGISSTLDMATLTQVSGGTGDFIVCQSAGGGELFVVARSGEVTLGGGVTVPAAQYINWAATVTTAPTTGLTKGDMFVAFATSSPVLGICTSTAGKTLKYISPFDTKTLGRAT
jgi:hypothetical protein